MLHIMLRDKQLILASSSPRRLEIFRMAGLNPEVCPSDVDEPIDRRFTHHLVLRHAASKAHNVQPRYPSNSIIVAADTLVCVGSKILGKPKNEEEAKYFLSLLSGRNHNVYTGVCILWNEHKRVDYVRSRVSFKHLSQSEIDNYVKTAEPMDKAGAYGIQGYGGQFIHDIKGCYFNVMGFPLNLFYNMISELIRIQTKN
jgi:septum formation protein